MELGFAVPTAGSWATPDNQVELSRRAEELGYASLWTFQRLLYPADVAGSDTPARWTPTYRSVHDPLITLAYLAGQTSRARLGVAVLNLPWYSPLVLAKLTATLDVVSNGRLDVGLGLGWAAEEYRATNVPMTGRAARAEEFIAALRACWVDDPVEHHGPLWDIGPARVVPKPLQRPHPPLLLGGSVEPALRRAGRMTDGWISSSGQRLESMGEAVRTVRAAAEEAGRDPATVRIVCRGVVKVRPGGAADRRMLTGSYAEIGEDLTGLAAEGVTEVFLDLNFDPEIGSPDADPAASVDRAYEMLEKLAP